MNLMSINSFSVSVYNNVLGRLTPWLFLVWHLEIVGDNPDILNKCISGDYVPLLSIPIQLQDS